MLLSKIRRETGLGAKSEKTRDSGFRPCDPIADRLPFTTWTRSTLRLLLLCNFYVPLGFHSFWGFTSVPHLVSRFLSHHLLHQYHLPASLMSFNHLFGGSGGGRNCRSGN